MRGLTPEGTWTTKLAGTARLAPGVAYLVRYADAPSRADYTAPLDVRSETGAGLPSDGLNIKAGLYSNRVKLLLRDLTGAGATAVLSLPQGATSKVALFYVRGTDDEVDLRANAPTVTVAAGGETLLEFKVPTLEQAAAGESLLAISDSTLGVRWLVPLASAPAARSGLWVGDVTINDVSQARLGATDARALTVRMAAANSSGVSGTADLGEVGGTTVKITVTLTLPAVTTPAETPPEMTTPYVHGRVFIDANQNGKADRTEGGLTGVTVTFGAHTATTLADGAYWLPVTGADSPPIAYGITAPTVAGYTSDFPVYVPSPEITEPPTPPITTTNQLPASVTIDSLGAITATPQSYLNQVLPSPYTLPMWDEDGQRVEPKLNFGFVREDQAGIYAGACGSELRDRLYPPPGDPPYAVVNGSLTATVPATLADLIGANTTNNISVLRDGVVIACGDIVVGAPTAFSNGSGSVARFRIILRVSSNNKIALLPYHALNETQRVSAANFLSIQRPITITGPFGETGTGLVFDMTIPGNDPLNPFKHKYNPDHDNLDRAFAPIESSKLYESYDVDRLITLTLRDLPSDLAGLPLTEAEAAAQSLDWGGAVWGGDYREVLDGLHKNTITVRGTFIIRQMLTFDQLIKQDYDK